MYKPQLRTFLAVCDAGSFTAAAQVLYITPSAVVQQINTLERDLGVKLLSRGKSGTAPTPAGEYLRSAGLDYIRRSEDIRRELLSIASSDHQICIGTSLFEKCRLLYNLWVLFSAREKHFEIQMVNIVMGQTIPAKTDLIESVNSGVAWMPDWDFLKICDVPFGFAVPEGHPLSRQETISPQQLQGETVMSLDQGTSPLTQSVLGALRSLGVNIEYPSAPGQFMLWEPSFKKHILLVPVCWGDILLNMKVVRCAWSCTIPYGIFYRRTPTPDASHFLDFIRETYEGRNPEDVVPIL